MQSERHVQKTQVALVLGKKSTDARTFPYSILMTALTIVPSFFFIAVPTDFVTVEPVLAVHLLQTAQLVEFIGKYNYEISCNALYSSVSNTLL